MKKQFSNLQLNLFVVFSLFFVFILCFGSYVAYQERLNLISYFFPPAPEIIATDCGGMNDPWLEIGTTVKTTVRNNGGRGKIRVVTLVTQGSSTYQKSFEVMISDFETRDFVTPFDEIIFLGGEISCKSEVKVLF